MAPTNPSISFPPWMHEEVDARRRTGEDQDDIKRSPWVQEAAFVRMLLEDRGEFEALLNGLEVAPEHIDLKHDPVEAVPDGGG